MKLFLLSQDVVLQWLMTDNIQLNQIDAEDPEVRKRSVHGRMAFLIVFSLSFFFFLMSQGSSFLLVLFFVPQITDYTMLPDTGCLSEQLRVCLQEGDENPRDFTSLFDMSLFNLSTDTLPQVIR